jgi:spermidine/putrescine transport system substrate-binding protein
MSEQDPIIDPSFLRGLTQRRVSRRDALRYAGLGLGGVSLSAFLAACGVSGSGSGTGTGTGTGSASNAVGSKTWWDQQTVQGTLNFANWPYYIDTKKGQHPTLETFQKKYGITVNYRPTINGNAEFFAKLKPFLEQGKDTGWDIIVITNGPELSQLIDNHWLVPLDVDLLPNFEANASPLVKDPAYDQGNTYTVAWQSGFTGLGYSPEAVQALGRAPNSLEDLWDPRLKGHIGMMNDDTELGSIGLLKIGVEPSQSTPDDWRKAAAVLKQQRDAGLVRGYFSQSYINQLQDHNTWLSQAWSGDIFIANQSGYPELKFFVPKEGVMMWTDNMMIPALAQHPKDAITYMNYAYDPEVAALLADYIWYVTPVPAAKDIILNKLHDPAVAKSPLIFPDKEMISNTHQYYVFQGQEDLQEWNSIFQPIIQG